MAILDYFKNKTKTPFLLLYDRVVGWMEAGEIITPEGNRYSKGTIYNYKKRRINIEAFKNKRGHLFIEEIDVDTLEDFELFLNHQNFCKNTVGTCVAGFKAMLNILYKKKLTAFNGSGVRVRKELTTAVFNSIEEIQILLNTSFAELQRCEIVRDVYVIHCFVGLRFGDLRKVLRDPKTYIRTHGNRRFFELKTQKTGELVVIPLSNIVEHLLGKYAYNFGNLFTYQHYNRCIKEMALVAGLTQEIECTRTKGGIRQDYYIKKCDMMSSHTARRTFATNAVLSKGFSTSAIMKITGHKTMLNFERYIRCSVLESAIAVADNEFFSIAFEVSGKIISSGSQLLITD